MAHRKSIWEWSCEYVGDPSSWYSRGSKIFELLKANGMTPQSRVLELGCGNLSQGKPLIEFLAPGHYYGIEPFGLLVEAGLAQFPGLEAQSPRFAWNSEFDGSSFGVPFDFVLAHSVLSHAAHDQLALMLANTRAVVGEGAVFLCSYRRGEQNSFARDWRYPDVNYFRLETIEVTGLHAGWRVEQKPEYQAQLRDVAPNDLHDWLRMTSVPTAAATNDFRLAEEERQREEREELEQREAERVAALLAADAS